VSAWRTRVRDTIESMLTRLDAPGLARRASKGRRVILSYHNIVDDPAQAYGDGSLHLPLPAFRAQMDELRRHYLIVPLASMRTPPTREDRLRVAITFDDAYAGAVRHGLPVLAELGLPATMFVAPGRLGGQAFWWDALEGTHGDGPTTQFRTEVLANLGGDDARARASAERFGLSVREVPPDSLTATEVELRHALVANRHLTLGSHSWNHPSLPRLDNASMRSELELSYRWLRRFGARGVPWIAYPYGEFNRLVEYESTRAGYEGVVRIGGGTIGDPERRRFTLPRINIASRMTTRGFALRVAGVLR
jgi:peptidoglycan/xylan/chitin deacetylase (PgdA/CDA1 family)